MSSSNSTKEVQIGTQIRGKEDATVITTIWTLPCSFVPQVLSVLFSTRRSFIFMHFTKSEIQEAKLLFFTFWVVIMNLSTLKLSSYFARREMFSTPFAQFLPEVGFLVWNCSFLIFIVTNNPRLIIPFRLFHLL